MRQVAGLIARTIVSPTPLDAEVERGQRMGMIKFGSRTELLLPPDADVTIEAKIGDAVQGASTVLLRYNKST